jgi:superfamily II DNA or RNA helicase
MGSLRALLAQLDPNSEQRRGRQFEAICQWYLSNDPLYSQELRKVWLWGKWPGRRGADTGIDLVAEDRQGRLWAIQAKCYDPNYSVTKRDVDSFLSASGRSEFSFRLLIATTNRIGHNARHTLQGQEKQAHVLRLAELERAHVNWPESPDVLRSPPPKPKRPRPHQRKAIQAVVMGFRSADRGQMIMACGTGKTLTALFIAESLGARRTLVLVPSLSLLRQTLGDWAANATEAFDPLPVCSDDTVTHTDALVATTSDLGFPVTTDAEEIGRFLRRRGRQVVVFSTYQSSPRIAEAFKLGRVPPFDLVIADEAHRCAGRVSADFATVLDAAAIPGKRRLFMTATPRYFTGRVVKEAQAADFEVASMDDPVIFGPVLHRLSFGEAIERELLSDYQVAVVGVDDDTYREWARGGRFVTVDGTKLTDARTLASHIGVAKAMQRYDLRRVISFHSRVTRARQFAQALPEVIDWMPPNERPDGKVEADYVSGEMSADERSNRLDAVFELDADGRGLVANARCLAEGVDVPDLDGVAFIDPRRSEVDIVQAVGRAIRKAEDKSMGTIVIPVFVEASDDPADSLEASTFKPVWDVIRALRAHDADLAVQLDALRRQLGQGESSVSLPSKIHLDLPAHVGVDFSSAFEVRLVTQTTESWEFWLGALERYVADEGHAAVPTLYVTPDGVRGLGPWVGRQRAAYARGQLQTNRIERLESLPGWTWDPAADAWEAGFRRLQAHARTNDVARPPSDLVDPTGYRVGQWAASQRVVYKAGELSEDRVARLESLPGWTWDVLEADWEEGYERLSRYAVGYGQARPPSSYADADGFRLGPWVAQQRTFYRLHRMSAERIARLEAVPGWTWTHVADKWEAGFGRLVAYVEDHGNARPPALYVDHDGFRLGKWVGRQRRFHDEHRLTAERAGRLEALSGWSWDGLVQKWDDGYQHLTEFARERGHARVTKRYVADDGYRLGQWVDVQRIAMRSGTLSQARSARLEAQPGWDWERTDDSWEKALAHLVAFVERTGHSMVPKAHKEQGFGLGTWVSRQRTRGPSKLGPVRAGELEALPGWTWDKDESSWDLAYDHLVAFVGREGHARVPQSHIEDGFKLGQWVSVQRGKAKNKTLRADRTARLEALPGWTWAVRNSTTG